MLFTIVLTEPKMYSVAPFGEDRSTIEGHVLLPADGNKLTADRPACNIILLPNRSLV